MIFAAVLAYTLGCYVAWRYFNEREAERLSRAPVLPPPTNVDALEKKVAEIHAQVQTLKLRVK